MGAKTEEGSRELVELREEVARLREQQESLRAEMHEQREAFSRELVRKAFRIAELERGADKAIGTYENSLSWRATRPLRAAMAMLRRRRGTA